VIVLIILACIGLFAIALFVENKLLKSNVLGYGAVVLPVTEKITDVEYTIRTIYTKTNELECGSLVIWNLLPEDSEGTEIAKALAHDLDIAYLEGPASINEILEAKLCLQSDNK